MIFRSSLAILRLLAACDSGAATAPSLYSGASPSTMAQGQCVAGGVTSQQTGTFSGGALALSGGGFTFAGWSRGATSPIGRSAS